MAYFSMQTSAWILTLITIDRYLIISSNTWMQKYSKSMKFSLIVILIIIVLIALINFPVALLNGKINTSTTNGTQEKHVICYSTSYIKFWQKFSLLLECIFPLIIMTIFNILLVKRTYKSSTKFTSAMHNSSKTKSNCNKNYSEMNVSPKESHIQPSKASNSFIDEEPHQYLPIHAKFTNKLSTPDKHDSFRLNTSKKLNKSDSFLENLSPNRIANKTNSKIKFLDVKNTTEILCPKMDTISSYEENEEEQQEELMSINIQINQKDDSLANLNFLKSGNVSFENLNYTEPSGISFLDPSCLDQTEHGDCSSDNNNNNNNDNNSKIGGLEKKYHTTNGHSERKVSNLRNRRIVVMLSLLTLSFTISTVPSSIFYTFFRPMINDKPYKRLFTLIFNLVRHLSHAFNFIIYFTSSSVIKRELKESIKEFREKKFLTKECFLSVLSSLKKLICFLPLSFKRHPTRKSNGHPVETMSNQIANVMTKGDIEAKEKSSLFRERMNSIITLNRSGSLSENFVQQHKKETFAKHKDDSLRIKRKSLKCEKQNETILESSI